MPAFFKKTKISLSKIQWIALSLKINGQRISKASIMMDHYVYMMLQDPRSYIIPPNFNVLIEVKKKTGQDPVSKKEVRQVKIKRRFA